MEHLTMGLLSSLFGSKTKPNLNVEYHCSDSSMIRAKNIISAMGLDNHPEYLTLLDRANAAIMHYMEHDDDHKCTTIANSVAGHDRYEFTEGYKLGLAVTKDSVVKKTTKSTKKPATKAKSTATKTTGAKTRKSKAKATV